MKTQLWQQGKGWVFHKRLEALLGKSELTMGSRLSLAARTSSLNAAHNVVPRGFGVMVFAKTGTAMCNVGYVDSAVLDSASLRKAK